MKSIYASSKRHGNFEFKVDDEDFDFLSQFTWSVAKRGHLTYLQTKIRCPETGKRRCLLLHRLIMNCLHPWVVDHISRDTTDNRKENLRIVDHATNLRNCRKRVNTASMYRGVSRTRNGMWRCRIKRSKIVHLGVFTEEIDAAKAYDNYLDINNLDNIRNFPK